MNERLQDIIALITSYTSELELLDQLNITYIMTCLGTIGVILSIIVAIESLDTKVWKTPPYKIVAPLFLTIPVIVCIFLGVVTLNCRKVAVYRCYLVYLERAYNQIEGVIPQYYNSEAQAFIGKWGIDNLNGSLMNRMVDVSGIIVIALLLVVCFALSNNAFKKAIAVKGYKSKKFKNLFYVAYFMIMGVCILICIACFYDLILNKVTVEKVLQQFVY